MAKLQNKTIVIGVSGGIAAYKAVDVVSRLKKLGANVRVVMTANACEFVAPLTFQSMSQNPVALEMFAPVKEKIEHISLADAADVFAVIPATANIIGKIANGIADDILTTSLMATAGMRKPILIAPAMNTNMYANPIVAANIEKLANLGYAIAEPGEGRLACGIIGKGKLAKVDEIVEKIVELVGDGSAVPQNKLGQQDAASTKDFTNKSILITAGATEEALDPVRFITNHSTGKMGYALARAAKERGANVILVSGPTNLPSVDGVETLQIRSALEMHDKVMQHAESADIIIKSAAVGDYRAVDIMSNKIKKFDDELTLKFAKNPDILQELGEKYVGKKIIVGFCMETAGGAGSSPSLVDYAREKLVRKHADIIIANDLNTDGAGFAGDTNVVTILDKLGNVEPLEKMSKDELAHKILDRISTNM